MEQQVKYLWPKWSKSQPALVRKSSKKPDWYWLALEQIAAEEGVSRDSLEATGLLGTGLAHARLMRRIRQRAEHLQSQRQ